jgi:PKHD-type hydroxylase
MNVGSYFCVPSIFTPEECDKIIKKYSIKYLHESTYVDYDANTEASKSIRKSKVVWIETTPENEWIYKRVHKLAVDFNDDKFKFSLDGGIQAIQFTKYEEGCHYTWHVDTGPTPTASVRKISITIQLSDPSTYEGGNLEIGLKDEDNVVATRDQGSSTLFCSLIRHRVTPVTNGTRYSLVVWITGPSFS